MTDSTLAQLISKINTHGFNAIRWGHPNFSPKVINKLTEFITASKTETDKLVWFMDTKGHEVVTDYDNLSTLGISGYIVSDDLPKSCIVAALVSEDGSIKDYVGSWLKEFPAISPNPNTHSFKFGTSKSTPVAPSTIYSKELATQPVGFIITDKEVDVAMPPICSDDDMLRLAKYSKLIDELRDGYEAGAFKDIDVKVMAQLSLLLFADDSPAGPKGWPRNFLTQNVRGQIGGANLSWKSDEGSKGR